MSFAEKIASIFKRNILVKIWTVGTGVIIARILGPASMGIWYILLMIPSYAEPFGRLKMDIASVYFIGKKKYGTGEVYFNLIATSVFSGAFMILLFLWQEEFIFTRLLKSAYGAENLVYLTLAYIPVNFIMINYSYLFLAKEEITIYNRLSVLAPLVSSALSLFFIIAFKWRVFSLVLAQLISGIVSIFYSAWKLNKTDRIVAHINFGIIKEMLKFGSKLYLVGIVNYLQTYISGVLVALYLFPSAVTFFKMGQEKALLLSMIPAAVGTILYPVIAKNGAGHDYISVKACRVTFLLLLIAAAVSAAAIKPVVYLLYGKEFLPQVIPFWILLPGVVFFGIGGVLSQHFIGKGNPTLVLKISFIPMVLQVILCISLIPRFGIIGASLATSLTYFLTGLITLTIFARSIGCRISGALIPRRSDVLLLLDFMKKQLLRYFKIALQGDTGMSRV